MLIKRRSILDQGYSLGKDGDLNFIVCSYFVGFYGVMVSTLDSVCSYFNGLYPELLLFSKEGGVLLYMGQEQGNLLGYSLGRDDSLSLGLEFSWGSLTFLCHGCLKCPGALPPALQQTYRRHSLPSLPSSLKPTHIFYLLISYHSYSKENRV